MGFAIEAQGLSRRFGDFWAVREISFEVAEGQIFGLLGANGAGKSTTIRMLCGLLRSSGGVARVAGHDINIDPELVKRRIGYMSQQFSLYRDLTVAENIEFFGGIYGLSPQEIDERGQWVLEMAGLRGREGTLAAELSGGWSQRLALGCAILHRPPVLFLDEPTGGVDPLSRRRFWDLINELAEGGTTILVTTHYLDEAEYCDDVCLMHAGQIVAHGAPNQLKREMIPNQVLQIITDEATRALDHLRARGLITEGSIFGRSAHVEIDPGLTDPITAIESELRGTGIRVTGINEVVPSLEDVFIHVIQHSIREEGE